MENGDGGTTNPAPDAGLPSDGAADGTSSDAALEDASPHDECLVALDCYASHPGMCAACIWPVNYALCIEHQCRCACDGRATAGGD